MEVEIYAANLASKPSSKTPKNLTWKRKQIQFPKRCVFLFIKYRTMDKVWKPSNSEQYTP
jgi:hypothetical protein